MDVLNSDFRCKWPSKNNFSELDISQSLVWQCPSLSPYFLLEELNRKGWGGGGGAYSIKYGSILNFATIISVCRFRI